MAELYERFDTDINHLGHLKKLKQLRIVEEFISIFECLDFRTKGMFDAFFRECFINGLKDEIRVHVLMARPQSWVEATKRDKESQQVVSSQNRKPSFICNVPHLLERLGGDSVAWAPPLSHSLTLTGGKV